MVCCLSAPMPQVMRAGLALVVARRVPEAEPEQLSLFECGVDLMALRRERAEVRLAKLAPNTRRAYGFDWADFARWCGAAGRASMPASPDTVSLYAVGLAQAGRLVSTIERHCAAIAHEHVVAGHVSPLSVEVREVLYGLRRRLGSAPKHAKAALEVEELRQVLAVCGEGPRGARDRAVLLLGFASAMRSAELVGLDYEDVTIADAGVVLLVRRSKTDQEGAGRLVGVHPGKRKATCPVRAVEAWIEERGRWAGPLFCRLSQPGDSVVRRRLRAEAIADIVQSCARRAGLEASRYGAHSLRAGMATAADAVGASTLAIMRRTGHKTVAMVERYVRHSGLFAVDPLRGVL